MKVVPIHTQKGFTLIEMIVSLGIFSIVSTMTVGSLLVLISGNQQLQGEQNAMTNLAFAIDSMTREMRTGSSYVCVGQDGYESNDPLDIFNDNDSRHENLDTPPVFMTRDCQNGISGSQTLQGVSFIEGGNSITNTVTNADRILYFYDAAADTIKRKVGDNAPQSIISSGVRIVDADFFVTGSGRLGGGVNNTEQPTVTLYIAAQQVGEPDKTYYLQTTVTQRILDL